MANSTPTDWYKANFLCSTDQTLLRIDQVKDAFGSEAIYWTKPGRDDLMEKMLRNSLCFGIYKLPESSSDIAGTTQLQASLTEGRRDLPQIGLGRVVTDHVSLAYITDVYILEEYQGKGLASWMLQCMNEVFATWPELRRILLITGTEQAQVMYEKQMGMQLFTQTPGGLVVMQKRVNS